MHRTGAGGDQQRAARVFLQQAGRTLGRGSATGSATKPARNRRFPRQRQDLAQQRIVSIATAHAAHKTARHPQRELPQNLRVGQARTECVGQPQVGQPIPAGRR